MIETINKENIISLEESLKEIETKKANTKKVTDGSDIEARNALLDSIMKIAESDDPEDQRLHEELVKKFTAKMEKFEANLKAIPRRNRRKIKGYASFSNRFKSRIGL